MSLSNTFAEDLLKLIFQAVAIANIADDAASGPLTHLYLALHTGDPGETGDQTTNECDYTGYNRVAHIRDASNWTVTGPSVSPAANITFPACTGGAADVVTHVTVGTASSGAGKVLVRGVLGGFAKPFTVTAADDTLVVPDIAFAVDDRCTVSPLKNQSLPAGITEGTVYFIKTASGSAITLSTTSGGSTLNITANGAGLIRKVTPLTVSSGVTPILSSSMAITFD